MTTTYPSEVCSDRQQNRTKPGSHYQETNLNFDIDKHKFSELLERLLLPKDDIETLNYT